MPDDSFFDTTPHLGSMAEFIQASRAVGLRGCYLVLLLLLVLSLQPYPNSGLSVEGMNWNTSGKRRMNKVRQDGIDVSGPNGHDDDK